MILEPVCAEFFAAIKFDGTRHPQAATGKTTQRSVIASLWFCRATRYVTQLPLKVLFKRRGRREYFGAKSLGMYLLLGILFTTLFYIPAQANQTQKVNAALNTEKKMRVLVLHSYHHGFTWSDNISAGIRSTFASHRDQVELLFEFMDVRRIHSDEYFNRLIDLYALKYGQKDLDAIICADDHALGFVLGRGRDLFRKVPIVFCSVSGYQSAMHSGREVTGLLDSIDIKSTLETALKLHPATENVFVVSDMTRTGRALKGAAEKIFKDFEPQVRFTYFEDMTIEDLSDRVAGLPDNSIVFLFIFNRDRAGRVFSHEQNLNILAKHCSVPIYSVWKFYLGHGIVGGKLTSGETEGKMAAEITLDILDGRKASDIPPVKSPSQYMFDHEVLDRYNVDRDLLPQGSLVINQPYSFYTESFVSG